jgi:tRNA threonylcarbamoyladenosine biosynthesis protein TsaE
MTRLVSCASETTCSIGYHLGRSIRDPIRIALNGDLGCGKTTLVQGLARGMGVDPAFPVTSPTYTLINEYEGNVLLLYHLDLYRLGDTEELSGIGWEDLLREPAAIVVEWPALLRADGFAFDLEISFQMDPDFNRIICLSPYGQNGREVVCSLLSLISN